MPKKIVNGIGLYYEVHAGKAPVGAPQVLLLSGLNTDHFAWYPILESLAENFVVILVDNRGVGQSDTPDGPYTTELMADDVAKLLQELSKDGINLSNLTILGHSLGGAIALHLAINFPALLRKLVLYSSFAKMDERALRPMKINAELGAFGVPPKLLIKNLIPWMYSEAVYSSDDKIEEEIDKIMSGPFPPTPKGYMAQLAACISHDVRDKLGSITVSTLVIGGEKDILSTPENALMLTCGIPTASQKLLKDMAHFSHLESSAAFVILVKSFITADPAPTILESKIGVGLKRRRVAAEAEHSPFYDVLAAEDGGMDAATVAGAGSAGGGSDMSAAAGAGR